MCATKSLSIISIGTDYNDSRRATSIEKTKAIHYFGEISKEYSYLYVKLLISNIFYIYKWQSTYYKPCLNWSWSRFTFTVGEEFFFFSIVIWQKRRIREKKNENSKTTAIDWLVCSAFCWVLTFTLSDTHTQNVRLYCFFPSFLVW